LNLGVHAEYYNKKDMIGTFLPKASITGIILVVIIEFVLLAMNHP